MLKSNLNVLLAERNLKITQVSNETGISRTTLTSLINGNSKGIQFDTLNTLCIYLGITPQDFFISTNFDIKIDITNLNIFMINEKLKGTGIVNFCFKFKNFIKSIDFILELNENERLVRFDEGTLLYFNLKISETLLKKEEKKENYFYSSENKNLLKKLNITFTKEIENEIGNFFAEKIITYNTQKKIFSNIIDFNFNYIWEI